MSATGLQDKKHALKNGRLLTIREAVSEDAEAVVAFQEETGAESPFLTYGHGEYGVSVEKQAQVLAQSHDSETQVILLGLIGDDIAGNLTFRAGGRPRTRHSGGLGMSVRQCDWGHGVGGYLLDALFVWASATGFIKKINLRVRPDNARAIALYQSHGFEIEGAIRKDLLVDGIYHDLIWMGREI